MSEESSGRLGKAGAKYTWRRAEKFAKDPERTRRLIDDALKKAGHRKKALSEVGDSLMALIHFVHAWVNGTYRTVPWQSIVSAIAALIYFVMPLDLMPDWIVALGFLDDASVIAWVIKSIKDDLDAFTAWKRAQAEEK